MTALRTLALIATLSLPWGNRVLAQVVPQPSLEAGLAACAKMAGATDRARCDEAVRRAAPCWTLTPTERRQCLTAAANAGGSTDTRADPCAQRADPDRCRETRAANEACAGEPAATRHRCIEARTMPRASDCARRRASEKFECETYNQVRASCTADTPVQARDCLTRDYHAPLQQVIDGLNPADCARPDPSIAAACELRERLLGRCGELPAGEQARCATRYARHRLIDCARLPDAARGRCDAHNAGFDLCRATSGAALSRCQFPYASPESQTPFCRSAVSFLEGPRAEWAECVGVDQAYGRCAARRTPPDRFAECIESELPVAYKTQRWLQQHAPVVR